MFEVFSLFLFLDTTKLNKYFIEYRYIHQIIFLFVLISLEYSCKQTNSNSFGTEPSKTDSVITWINKSKSQGLKQRKELLERAYHLNKNQKIDSIQNKYLVKIAYQAFRIKDSIFFNKVSKEALDYSNKLNDSYRIGLVHSYYGMYFLENEVINDAYFHFQQALKYFQSVRHDYNEGRMLYNMSVIQKNIKDYTGSEILSFQAIEKFKKLDKNLNIYFCYNLLGVVFNELKEYDKAIVYHKKALEILKLVENKRTLRANSLNNLGVVFQNKNNYKKAIEIFKEGLNNENLWNQDINNYARLIDNLAYNEFLNGDFTNTENDLNKALKIRDSLNYVSGIITSNLHLAEYFIFKKDTLKAIDLINKASLLSTQVNNNGEKLFALQLLSTLDSKNAKNYLDSYVALSDSLLVEERKLRNKFTRIRFETNQYIEETKKLSLQKQRLILGGSLAIIVLSLLYLLRIQRMKNKKLMLEKEQQIANEEILRLMLKQQSKLEEGKLKERQRISADLHDGVLSRIFGTRMGMGFLNINADEETTQKKNEYINELQDIEREIRNISHELNNELFSSHLNFITIVDEMISKQSKTGNFEYKLAYDKTITWHEINDHIKINCYRIIQEALQNISKYAQATLVHVNFVIENNLIKLTISDNGKGFDARKKRKGIGLKNIQTRTKNIDGEFKLNSNQKEGTSITIFIPY